MSHVKAAELTSTELEVLIDSMADMRRRIHETSDHPTPNLTSAINKFIDNITPATTRAVIVFQED
jgi:hypothetical protein